MNKPHTSPFSNTRTSRPKRAEASHFRSAPKSTGPETAPAKSASRKPADSGTHSSKPHSARPASAHPSASKTSAAKSAPKRAFASKSAPEHKPTAPLPPPVLGARVTRRASDRLRAGAVWVYSSDIEALGVPDKENPPALLPVADNRGLLLGTALYSPTSQISLRLVSREAVNDEQWLKLFTERLHAAIQRRKPLLAEAETDSVRLCFSEADQLPGLVIDKYAGLAIVQLLAKGLDSAAIREICVKVLRAELKLTAILERPDPRMRELEGLSAPNLEPLWASKTAKIASGIEFQLNGLSFHYDAGAGQKTGAFLDQRLNYAAARDWAARLGTTGRALDVCTYQGGFALHLAQVCEKVTGIDASHASLEVAEQNLEANRKQLKAEVDWVAADAFQLLRDWSDAGEKFDTIVLDPPAFAKTQRAVENALRGYKELNLRALRMLRPGGLLITCSCSHHVGWSDLESIVTAAAVDAGRRVRLLERRGAALDHPVVLQLAETEYLKCMILEVE